MKSIAKDIADTSNPEGYEDVLEIGPGMGVLTNILLINL
jgi:16S rRNA (adenine1518-N6/adenine1519-N6)-dimethyltransferase